MKFRIGDKVTFRTDSPPGTQYQILGCYNMPEMDAKKYTVQSYSSPGIFLVDEVNLKLVPAFKEYVLTVKDVLVAEYLIAAKSVWDAEEIFEQGNRGIRTKIICQHTIIQDTKEKE